MGIGLRIKELRDKKNMSQEELGDRLGVSKAQISKYEKGQNEPPLDKIKKIAEILGVRTEDLIKDKSIVKVDNNNEDPTLSYDYLMKENILLLRKLREYEQKEGIDLDKIIELKKKIDDLTELLKKKLG